MKKLFTLIVIAAFTMPVFAQAPGKMSYQAVVRNTAGELIVNQAIGLKVSILQGSTSGEVVFSETYNPNPQTNANGLLTIEIGEGTPTLGSLGDIDWTAGPFFLKTEADPSGGTNYSISGTSQLLSVPYALYAGSAGNAFSGDWAEITGKPTTLSGYGITDADGSETNELQSLSLSGTQLTLSDGGGTVTLPSSGGLSLPFSGTTSEGNYAFNISHYSDIGEAAGRFYSTHGVGLIGESFGGNGIIGGSYIPDAAGVFGINMAMEGISYGIYGYSESSDGTGVHGVARSSEGTTYGVRGEVDSNEGFSGYFEGGRFYVEGNTGIGTNNPTALLHTQGTDIGQGNAVFVGQFKNTSGDPPVSGPGTRMMWYPDKAAFRAGHVTADQWDKYNIGDLTIALGFGTIADGMGCVAIGYDTHASGQTSTAMGNNTTAVGWSSTASGFHTNARADYSMAIGAYNIGMNEGTGENGEWIPTEPIFEIGNGTSEAARSNAMTVLKNGNVGIGTVSPGYRLDIAGQLNLNKGITEGQAIYVNGSQALWFNGNYFSWGYGATWNYFADKVYIGPAATDPGSNHLVVNGSAAKPGGGSWATWSDSRLKDIYGVYSKGLNEISELRPVYFSYRKGNPVNLPDDRIYIGLVAQEVQEVFPEAVTEGGDGYLQLDIHPVSIALINAVKELKDENDQLRSEIMNLQRVYNQLDEDKQQTDERLDRLEKLLADINPD